jgi:hypothetical protein
MISKLKEKIEEFPQQKVEKKAKLSDILQKVKNREKLDSSKYS